MHSWGMTVLHFKFQRHLNLIIGLAASKVKVLPIPNLENMQCLYRSVAGYRNSLNRIVWKIEQTS